MRLPTTGSRCAGSARPIASDFCQAREKEPAEITGGLFLCVGGGLELRAADLVFLVVQPSLLTPGDVATVAAGVEPSPGVDATILGMQIGRVTSGNLAFTALNIDPKRP